MRSPYTETPALTLEEKAISFWSKVDRSSGPDSCWLWKGAVTAKWNYGCFQIGSGKVRGAHKIAWVLTNGDTGGFCVLHHCDNRVCVNPAHLYLGTKLDNARDVRVRGRSGTTGESNIHAKLTEEAVRDIRKSFVRYTPRKSNASELAARYGVSRHYIQQIAEHNVSWRHLR